jgi:hypothetical protein
VEAVTFRKHPRAIGLPLAEDSLVEDGIIERAVEAANFNAFVK